MSVTVLIVACAVPFVALFIFVATHQRRREARAMHQFAAALKGGKVQGGKAFGRWQGRDVSVSFFGRRNPPVFLTGVTATRHASPFVALLLPRSAADLPPVGKNGSQLQRRFGSTECAPRELFELFANDETAALLIGLTDTEVEVLPDRVNVQRRQILDDVASLRPLLDASVQLARRMEQIHEEVAGQSEEERQRRMAEVRQFLARFQ